MKTKTLNKLCGFTYLTVLLLITLLVCSFSGTSLSIIQDHASKNKTALAHNSQISEATVEKSGDELKSRKDIGDFFMQNLRYPKEARELGYIAIVEMFARVNANGFIDEILESKTEEDVVETINMVVVAYTDNSEDTKSILHDSFIAECKRVIGLLPKLNMPELYGELIKFEITFELH